MHLPYLIVIQPPSDECPHNTLPVIERYRHNFASVYAIDYHFPYKEALFPLFPSITREYTPPAG